MREELRVVLSAVCLGAGAAMAETKIAVAAASAEGGASRLADTILCSAAEKWNAGK
ncbi:MAG: hypothetical protein LBW77_04940 [Verrucomicrobiota bacterium]|jgi:hypothetical protein|nr:hypothetical protein [Verrucomicrobiota bacterium]